MKSASSAGPSCLFPVLSLQSADRIVLGSGRKGNQWLPLLQQQVQWKLKKKKKFYNRMSLPYTPEIRKSPLSFSRSLKNAELTFVVCKNVLSETTRWSVWRSSTLLGESPSLACCTCCSWLERSGGWSGGQGAVGWGCQTDCSRRKEVSQRQTKQVIP